MDNDMISKLSIFKFFVLAGKKRLFYTKNKKNSMSVLRASFHDHFQIFVFTYSPFLQ